MLYFYPKADTPGCTTQACGVRDHSADYAHGGAVVLGVSPDPVKAVSKFDQKYGLGFPLLADEDHEVARAIRRVGGEVDVRAHVHGQRAHDVRDRRPTAASSDVFRKVKPAEHDDLVLGAIRG